MQSLPVQGKSTEDQQADAAGSGTHTEENMMAARCKAGVKRTGYRRHVVNRLHARGKEEQIGDPRPTGPVP